MRLRTDLLTSALVAGSLTLASSPAAAQDLTGVWEVSSGTPRGTQTMTLGLVQEDEALVGTVTLVLRGRGGGGGSQTVDISDGTVDGSSFSFVMTIERGGNTFSQTFTGTFEGDAMEGTIQGGRGGGRPFSGTRGGG